MGCKAYILEEKLKFLKEILSGGIMKFSVGWMEDVVEYLNKLDNIDLGDGVRLRREAAKRVRERVHHRESIFRQNSKNRWMKEGDLNTRFFHNAIKERGMLLLLLTVQNNVTLEEVGEVKGEIKRYFEEKFKGQNQFKPVHDEVVFNQLEVGVSEGIEV